MASFQGTEEQKRISEWLTQSKDAAQRLIIKTDSISEQMFKSGDISGFFSLLGKFTYLDYRNILLLYAQYPQAADIAGASVWKNKVSKGSLFLKEEFQGKGISLLAPFTETNKEIIRLTWFTIKMYDVSQTYADKKSQYQFGYLRNKKDHIEVLLKSLRMFTTEELGISYIEKKTEEHTKTGMSCYIKNKVMYIRPKASEIDQLSYLIEYIIKINTDELCEKELILYLANAVKDSLFDIWNLPKQVFFAPPYESISGASKEVQKIFLNKSQYWVRTIEDCVLREYKMLSGDKDIIYDDIL